MSFGRRLLPPSYTGGPNLDNTASDGVHDCPCDGCDTGDGGDTTDAVGNEYVGGLVVLICGRLGDGWRSSASKRFLRGGAFGLTLE